MTRHWDEFMSFAVNIRAHLGMSLFDLRVRGLDG